MKSKASKKGISKPKSNLKIKKNNLKKKEIEPSLDESDGELNDQFSDIDDNEDYDDSEQEEQVHDNSDGNTDEESDEENEEIDLTVATGKVTMKMIKDWENGLENKTTALQTFKRVQQALTATVDSIKGSEDKDSTSTSTYIVKGPQIFNAVVRLCLRKVSPALHELFELQSLSDRPKKNKKWNKLKLNLKKYLRDLILLIKSISEPTVVEALLKKGVLTLLPFYTEFPKLSWFLMRHLGNLWCTSHEKVRVLALIAVFRLVKAFQEERRDKALKLLYISYVNNCRFTSPSTWPMIDFMRMSLVELYSVDLPLAYRHAFVYIRQLAFHLRNAMLVQKKDRLQLVYNWQYVHCLHFWSQLLAKTHPSPVMQPLIYPIVQISSGVMTLQPTSKYFPLVFHVCNSLTELSSRTDTFIPVLPYLVEMLHCQKLRVKPKTSSLKPFQWDCIIKVSKSQLDESAFTDGLIDQLFDCALTYLNSQCASIGFPELVLPATIQLKAFIKKCRIPAQTRKLKQLVDKMSLNSDFINERRKVVNFGITDTKAIKNWEIETAQVPPPLGAYFAQWSALKKKLRQFESPSEEEKDLFSIAAVRKRQKGVVDEFGVEYDVDDDEEGVDHEPASSSKKAKKEVEEPKKKKGDKATKRVRDEPQVKDEDEIEEEDDFEGDIVREMKLSDLEDSDDD